MSVCMGVNNITATHTGVIVIPPSSLSSWIFHYRLHQGFLTSISSHPSPLVMDPRFIREGGAENLTENVTVKCHMILEELNVQEPFTN